MGQVLSGISRGNAIELLLELGVLQAQPMKITTDLLDKAEADPHAQQLWLRYVLTAFGKALAEYVIAEMAPKESSLFERMGKIAIEQRAGGSASDQ